MIRIVNVRAGIPGIKGEQIVSTDSKGFRTTKDIDYGTNASYRIFAIGGSTTTQMFLNDRNTWTHLLQEHLSKTTKLDVEVINTGVDGLRAKHHLATLRNIIGLLPDMVIILVGINDWNRHVKKSFHEDNQDTKIETYRIDLSLSETMLGNLIWIVYNALIEIAENPVPSLRENPEDYFSKKRGH